MTNSIMWGAGWGGSGGKKRNAGELGVSLSLGIIAEVWLQASEEVFM